MTKARVRYQTIEVDTLDVHLCALRDLQEHDDPEGVAEALGINSTQWSTFGIVRDSAQVLARLMLTEMIEGVRILEVGCGIGLASLTLNHRRADITATDHHPEVGRFLDRNAALNDGPDIPFVRTGWADLDDAHLGTFDLIIASDVLYEEGSVPLLCAFIDRHLAVDGEVVIVDPGRGLHARFSRQMIARGFSRDQYKPSTSDYLEKPFNGRVLRYCRPVAAAHALEERLGESSW